MFPTAALLLAMSAPDDGYKPLFDGRSLAGWTVVQRDPKDPMKPNPDPKGQWTVADGVIRCTGKPNGYLATAKEYADYSLRVEWRYPPGTMNANSGVLLHVQADNAKDWPDCVEAQTKAGFAGEFWLDYPPRVGLTVEASRHDAKNLRHFYRLAGGDKAEKPLGEWNRYDIVCRGGAIALAINGTPVNDATDGTLKKGRIALQSEGSAVEFRGIAIK